MRNDLEIEIPTSRIQSVIVEIINNIDIPRSGSEQSYKHAVYMRWAGEELAQLILEKNDYSNTIMFQDAVTWTKDFRDQVSEYATWNPNTSLIFQSARKIADEVLDTLHAMK